MNEYMGMIHMSETKPKAESLILDEYSKIRLATSDLQD